MILLSPNPKFYFNTFKVTLHLLTKRSLDGWVPSSPRFDVGACIFLAMSLWWLHRVMWCVESSLPPWCGWVNVWCGSVMYWISPSLWCDVLNLPSLCDVEKSICDVLNQFFVCVWGLCCHRWLQRLLCGVECSLFLFWRITTLDTSSGNSWASLYGI